MSKVLVYSTRKHEKALLTQTTQSLANEFTFEFTEASLTPQTASAAQGFEVVSIFVNDNANHEVLQILKENGVRGLALRSAGFNHVDLEALKTLGLQAARVPAYSPYAVAEHALALLLTLNRKIHKAYNRVREGNFNLDGLMGFDIHGKTIGVVGTGKIGQVFCSLLSGFGCRILAFDPFPNQELVNRGVEYVSKEQLLKDSDIISLHCPLNTETKHFIDAKALKLMKQGVYLINTSRGALVDTSALIEALKHRHLGGLALDVYEEEEGVFFEDHSEEILQDDVLARLLSFPNVLLTGHQAFFTREAVQNICDTTAFNCKQLLSSDTLQNSVL